jgi:ABC-type nickel/cobalt efflux system permease component RcnA
MTNPFRSEADAFRFLLGAAVYFGLIAAASAIDSWLGFAVFVLITAAGAWWLFRRRAHAGSPT